MSASTAAVIVTVLLILAAMATATHELEVVQMARAAVTQARNWARGENSGTVGLGFDQGLTLSQYSDHQGALSDCATLYDQSEFRLGKLLLLDGGENHTLDDARAWLSGVVANHVTCLDGLAAEKGLSEFHTAAGENLTVLLNEALDLYANNSLYDFSGTARKPRKPRLNNQNGVALTSWDPASSRADFVVAHDGSGTYRTINEAVSALSKMGQNRPERAILYVKAGVYHEKVEIERHMKNLMFVGDGIDRTIITGSRNVPDGSTTFSSATFGVSGDGFWARDMTFENTAGPHKHQAVALRVNSDLSMFYRCSFRAYQDTLFVHSLRQFYRDCHIYGTIDYIFGDAAVVFQNCDIFIRRPMNHQANMITAQGRDNPNSNTGISIQGCRVRPTNDLRAVKDSFTNFLGRPWKKYSRTVFMKTDLDAIIHPKGWTEWEGSFAISTLYYAEYMNVGEGASTANRVKWPGFHVLKDPKEASPFTVSKFIQGDAWIPMTGVPFWLGI